MMTPADTALHKAFSALVGRSELDGAQFVALIALGHRPDQAAWWALTASAVDYRVHSSPFADPTGLERGRLAKVAGGLIARALLVDPDEGFVDDVVGRWLAATTPMRELALRQPPWEGDAHSVWGSLLIPHDVVADSIARLPELERAYVLGAVRLTGDRRANLVLGQFLGDPSPLVQQALGDASGDALAPEPAPPAELAPPTEAPPPPPKTEYSASGVPLAPPPPPPEKR